MRILTWLTVIYAVVLVLALAVSLITIFFYLWRIGSALAEVKRGLVQGARDTAPLERHRIHQRRLERRQRRIKVGDGHLAGVDDSLTPSRSIRHW